MRFIETALKGAYIIEPEVFRDHRGFFLESYNRKVFEEHGLNVDFVQDNHSLSDKPGVLRGLHFQRPPYEQTKLVRVVAGRVLDVIVDLRKGSPTYGEWLSVELSMDNKRILFVPKGFAHGFCTLEEKSQVLYKVDEFYNPGADGGLRWNDSDVAISWPTREPIMSEKDKNLPLLSDLGDVFP